MNRPNLLRTSLLLVILTWNTSVVAQDASTPTADKPANESPTIDPVVITAPPAPAATTPATTTPATTTPATTTPAATTPAATTPAATTPAPTPPAASTGAAPELDAATFSTTTLTPPVVPGGDASETTEAPEHEGRFVLMAVMENRWNTSAGYDLFAEDDVLSFLGLALGADLVSFRDRLTLAVELGWNTASTHRNDVLGGDIGRTELNVHHAQASVVARYSALPWLAPHARLTLGLSFLDLALQSNGDDKTFEDHTTSPSLGLGIGTSIQTPPGTLSRDRGPFSHVQIGLRAELGYTLASDAGFTLKDSSDLRVPSAGTSLGGLARSGPSIHTALFVRL